MDCLEGETLRRKSSYAEAGDNVGVEGVPDVGEEVELVGYSSKNFLLALRGESFSLFGELECARSPEPWRPAVDTMLGDGSVAEAAVERDITGTRVEMAGRGVGRDEKNDVNSAAVHCSRPWES